ncbi:hypothetical protein GW17_00044570 [Ensete ventricosum]|nr:hypothetical protein GW17_00044570 [Ensete ventricosum]
MRVFNLILQVIALLGVMAIVEVEATVRPLVSLLWSGFNQVGCPEEIFPSDLKEDFGPGRVEGNGQRPRDGWLGHKRFDSNILISPLQHLGDRHGRTLREGVRLEHAMNKGASGKCLSLAVFPRGLEGSSGEGRGTASSGCYGTRGCPCEDDASCCTAEVLLRFPSERRRKVGCPPAPRACWADEASSLELLSIERSCDIEPSF